MAKRTSLQETAKAAQAVRQEPKETETAGLEPAGEVSVMNLPRGQKIQLSIRIDERLLERTRDTAWWSRMSIVDVLDTALREFIDRQEIKRGSPFPQREGDRRGRMPN